MYGPDPFTIMAYSKMLAAEQEEKERHRARRPKVKASPAAERRSLSSVADKMGGFVQTLFRRRAVAYRG